MLPANLDNLPVAAATDLQCTEAASPPASAELSIGNFRTLQHLVAGEVVVINKRVLEVRNFFYDGQGPDAFVWIDSGR